MLPAELESTALLTVTESKVGVEDTLTVARASDGAVVVPVVAVEPLVAEPVSELPELVEPLVEPFVVPVLDALAVVASLKLTSMFLLNVTFSPNFTSFVLLLPSAT